jgi:hypothetical protein
VTAPDPASVPWDREDALYLKLKGARERLCLAQMLITEDSDRRALQTALDAIDFVGVQLPQWSEHDRMDVPPSAEAQQ